MAALACLRTTCGSCLGLHRQAAARRRCRSFAGFSTFRLCVAKGRAQGETFAEDEIFDFGGDLCDAKLSLLKSVSSLVRSAKPATEWVENNIIAPATRAGVDYAPASLLAAPPLSSVVQLLVDAIPAKPRLPLILAGQNAHDTDWKALYWGLLQAGSEPHALLKRLGVFAVLDTLKREARQRTAEEYDRLAALNGSRKPRFLDVVALRHTLPQGARPHRAHRGRR